MKAPSKKGLTIRRSLILVWSLVLIVYPLLFVFDIAFNAQAVPAAETGRLSALIPSGIIIVSQFLINTILRLFSIINSGKLVKLVGMLRELSVTSEQVDMSADRQKWKPYYIIWLVYAGIFLTLTYKLVKDFATAEHDLKGSKFLFMPESDAVRIIAMQFVFITTAFPPCFLFHFVVSAGSQLIHTHGSICTELCDFLAAGPVIMMVKNIKTIEASGGIARIKALRLQERFSRLKECFKMYEHFAGIFAFCIMWWIFVVMILFCSSITSDGVKRMDLISYGVGSAAFTYVVASFGEHIASSIDHGREDISDALGRLRREPKFFEDEGNADMVSNFVSYLKMHSSDLE